jgi:uncharacterized protein (DUF1778 family)
LNLRVTAREKSMIEEAARVASRSVSSFIVDSATSEAQRLLSGRTVFTLDPESWDRFVAALDRPATDKPRLKALLGSPGVFEES